MSSLSRELVFLILQFLDEEKFKETVHKLEQESGFYFNMKYFEDEVINGNWDEVERYLGGFTKVDDNRYSMKIFFEIRKQKYLEALDKHDRSKAVEILVKDLKVFASFNEELFKEITQLLTLENFRENEQLSKYGDTKSARAIMLVELKKLIEANPLFRDKLQFPNLKSSRLRTLINQLYYSRGQKKKKKTHLPPRLPAVMAGGTAGVDGGGRSLDCRSFWKAGAHEGPSAPIREFHDALETGDFDRARVHPKFLHTNATSHKWAFGAISELLDNAVDEICNGATFIKVDKSTNMKDNSAMLVFQDDGGGMDPEGVRQCMSLGFSTKKSKTTIGQYGNGFKTSTMRLGADAIVFTRAIRESKVTLSIGLLSYTFLRRTMKDDIVVPMLDFEVQDGQIAPLVYGSQGDWDSSLKIILDWSPFSSKEELLQQFEDMDSHGTKVVIYNLWMNDDGLLELDFDDDDEDILLRDQGQNSGASTKIQKEIIQQHISHRLRFSLRAYTSILYLRKFENFQIILRGKPVEQINIANELKFKKVVTYKPHVAHDSQVVSVKVDIGFAKEAPVLGIFGINVYHKNRLIMPFWKVLQEASSRGRSVIGVLEANFIEPAHDKQDFERTPLFIRLETKLKQIIVDYWKEKCHLIGYQPIDPKLRSQYKAALKDSGGPGAKIRHEASTAQKTGGHLSNLLPQTYDDAAAFRLTANRAGSALHSSGQAQDSMNSAGLEEDLVDIGSLGVLDPSCNEKLSEENLVLFTRREDLRQRDTQLKQTIGELEHELEETKRKCSQLAAELQLRRSQQQHYM